MQLKQVQLVVGSRNDSSSGNEYLNLLFLREVLNQKRNPKQACMGGWIFGARRQAGGRNENKVKEPNRKEKKAKSKTEITYTQEKQSCNEDQKKQRNKN